MRLLRRSLIPALIVLTACAKKDDTGQPEEEGIPDPGDSVVVETSRGPVFSDYMDLGVAPGLVGVPNIDDDDRDGQSDWVQEGQAAGDNDYALGSFVTHGRAVSLTLRGSGVRVYQGTTLLLDEMNNTAEIQGDIDFRVEYDAFLAQAELLVQDLERADEFNLVLTASPLFLNHHLQPAEETMALVIRGADGWDNNEFVDGYEEVLGSDFIGIPGSRYDYDPWVQDEFEFGYATSPDSHLDVIFDTHRNGQGSPGEGLDDFPEDGRILACEIKMGSRPIA